MASHYVCGICGRNVATFQSWKDVEPSDIVELLVEELEEHNVNTTDMDPVRIMSRFRIEDDEASGGTQHDGTRASR